MALAASVPTQILALSLSPASAQGEYSLRQHANDAKLLFGFAVEVSTLRSNAAYRDAVEAMQHCCC
jgi:hypothetical protein